MNPSHSKPTQKKFPSLQIRGVEIGIVVLVLFVWAGAIGLFFNRWGKIRMLLPYQPDYKQDQLKVPGTGVCATGACNGQHSHQVTPLMVNFDSHQFNSVSRSRPYQLFRFSINATTNKTKHSVHRLKRETKQNVNRIFMISL